MTKKLSNLYLNITPKVVIFENLAKSILDPANTK